MTRRSYKQARRGHIVFLRLISGDLPTLLSVTVYSLKNLPKKPVYYKL